MKIYPPLMVLAGILTQLLIAYLAPLRQLRPAQGLLKVSIRCGGSRWVSRRTAPAPRTGSRRDRRPRP